MSHNEFIAAAVLIGLAIALVCSIGVALRRSPYRPLHALFYFFNVLLTRLLWRAKVQGQLDLPPGQGAVIVCNHRSSVDPFFIQLVAGRVVHWMVAAEYFKLPFVGSLLRSVETIPTSRGGIDTASTRAAIRYATSGGLVGMLPEGRINDTPAPLLPVRPGAVLVAMKARVPIVPCYLHDPPYDGTVWGCFFMRARVRMVVGQPIDLSAHYDDPLTPQLQAELILRVMRQVAQLGGHHDFEPVVAGRNWKPGLAPSNST